MIAFPLERRVGKIRDVALKMLEKATDRHAEYYRKQVTEAIIVQMDRIDIPHAEQDEQLTAFWSKVQDEMIRISYRGTGSNDPRGAA